jgi:hypothetical protein
VYTYDSSSFTVILEALSLTGRKRKSTRWPGKRMPTEDLPSSTGFISTGLPPSRVITCIEVPCAKPRVIPVSDLIVKQSAFSFHSVIWNAYPVFTTLILYELFPSRIKGGISSAAPIQSKGRAGTALEQSNRPAPFTSIESGTGCSTSATCPLCYESS